MLQWQYFLKLETIIRVWYIYYLAIVEAVSLVSPFFQQTLHTQHLAKGVFQPCAVLRLCGDTEGRIVPQINKEIVLQAVLACVLGGLAFEAQTVIFCRAKGEFVGAAGWQLCGCGRTPVVRWFVAQCCTSPGLPSHRSHSLRVSKGLFWWEIHSALLNVWKVYLAQDIPELWVAGGWKSIQGKHSLMPALLLCASF